MENQLLGIEASHDLDRLQVLMDVSEIGTSGYQAADWLREHRCIDVGMSDHRRVLATVSFADTTRSIVSSKHFRHGDTPPNLLLTQDEWICPRRRTSNSNP